MREKEFTCPEKVSAKAKQNEKISILYNTKVLEVRGDEEMIKSITYCNDLTGEKTTFAPDNERFGVFIFAGYEPATEFVRDIIKLNDKDYIVTDCAKKTSIDGVYAALDPVKLFSDILKSGDKYRVGYACRRLADLDAYDYLNDIYELSKGKNRSIAYNAAMALARLGYTEGVAEYILKIQNDAGKDEKRGNDITLRLSGKSDKKN